MSYIKQSLSADEKIEHLFKLHWIVSLTAWLYVAVGTLMWIVAVPFWFIPDTGGAGWFITSLAVLFSWLAIFKFLEIKFQEFGVTNKRVIYKRGIISRKSNEMKLTSIETVEINQGILDRIFGSGAIVITGRGTSDVVFKTIDDPMSVKNRVESISNPID